MRLYQQFKSDLHYLYSAWLPGYDLYSLGNYPYAIKSDDPTHQILIEVMRISDTETEKQIHKIELEAGYYSEEVNIGEDTISIYLFEETANNLRIVSGDWAVFFGH